jgi:pentatricopeptide repeat protein
MVQWAKVKGYDLNAYHYTAVVSVLARGNKWQDAVQLLDMMNVFI